jgi:hypothetical protein
MLLMRGVVSNFLYVTSPSFTRRWPSFFPFNIA